jgi:hypothetical protein
MNKETHLAEVETEAGAVLAHLGLRAVLPRKQLHLEHPELVFDAAHLQLKGDREMKGLGEPAQPTSGVKRRNSNNQKAVQPQPARRTLFTTVFRLGFLSRITCTASQNPKQRNRLHG